MSPCPFNVAAEGGNHGLQIRCRGDQTERITVKIPPGVQDGGTIRLAGQGQPGPGGGPAGDLLLTVHVSPHPYFHREGAICSSTCRSRLPKAALALVISAPTLFRKGST